MLLYRAYGGNMTFKNEQEINKAYNEIIEQIEDSELRIKLIYLRDYCEKLHRLLESSAKYINLMLNEAHND
jgi:hypothetical protein